MSNAALLTPAWTQFHDGEPQQREFYLSEARFNVAVATRRGGKSDIGRRRMIKKALKFSLPVPDPYMVITAPTRDQVKRLHWEQSKSLVPDWALDDVAESELTIKLVNGVKIQLLGMDKPQRAEGMSIDHALIDEVADMKPIAWTLSLRPSLSTEGRPGSADFIGKPRGKAFYYELYQRAETLPDWRRFHWDCYGILDPEEIEAAKRELSDLQFAQEYLADWVTFEGRCYYGFSEEIHASIALQYDAEAPLDLCFDFNVKPGTATIIQPQSIGRMGYNLPPVFANDIDAVIGEVYISDNSNTQRVCQHILKDWGNHAGQVRLFGDFSGGSRKTSATEGSDWDQVQALLGPAFGGRMSLLIQPPTSEVARINALNARIMSADDRAHMLVDPTQCPHTVNDLLSVTRLENGKIDKMRDVMITHLSDGIGDRARFLYPTTKHLTVNEPLYV